MYEVMRSAWPGTQVHVGTDLLGAARALHGDHPGLVLVLGTGMSCGHYDGRSIRKAMPSLGWILGDEGSGADLGKRMVTDGLAGRLSKELSQVLFPEGLERGNVLQQVYRSAAPQAYLAAFAKRLRSRVRQHMRRRCWPIGSRSWRFRYWPPFRKPLPRA